MADEDFSEDQWLYGDSNPDKSKDGVDESDLLSDKTLHNADLAPPGVVEPPGILEPPIIKPPQITSFTDEPSKPNADEDLPPGVTEDEGEEKNGDKQGAAATAGEEEEEEEGGGGGEKNKEEGEIGNADGEGEDAPPPGEGGGGVGGGGGEEDEEEDSDEDNINIVIGEIKTTSQYSIKRGGLITSAPPPQMKQPGKFSIDEFETVGAINGVPAQEFSIEALDEKPWRKPGADITDYFNYGFNEDTWRAYCERQKRIRLHESGSGLGPLGVPQAVNSSGGTSRTNIPVTIVNDNSKYMAAKGAGGGAIPAGTLGGPRPNNEGNAIQVMTADRREYSRKGFQDMMGGGGPMPIPPAGFGHAFPPPGYPPPGVNEFYNSEMDPYYQSYEPTQDSQWMNTSWNQDNKPMPPSGMRGNSDVSNQDSQDAHDRSSLTSGLVIKVEKDRDAMSRERDRDRDRDRDRERDRDRDRDRDRYRERDRSHRHRSRSRSQERKSRKHKSRSRSPGHRSHKKKKAKKSDRTKDESD